MSMETYGLEELGIITAAAVYCNLSPAVLTFCPGSAIIETDSQNL